MLRMLKFMVFFCILCSLKDIVHGDDASMDDIIRTNDKDGVMRGMTDGDIPNEDIQSGSIASNHRNKKRFWSDGVIPYTLSDSYNHREKDIMRQAMRDIENAARCLRFQEFHVNNPNKPYSRIDVKKAKGCWSHVGRTGSPQTLSIVSGCMKRGSVTHELMHALGFFHEHSRPDRDRYIVIHKENIRRGAEGNFQIFNDLADLNVGYDPKSILQYRNYYWTNGLGPTIEWKNDKKVILGGNVLSHSDKLQLQRLYCGRPKTTIATTKTLKTDPPTPPTKPPTQPTRPPTPPTRPPSPKSHRLSPKKTPPPSSSSPPPPPPRSSPVQPLASTVCSGKKDMPSVDCEARKLLCASEKTFVRYIINKYCAKTCCVYLTKK